MVKAHALLDLMKTGYRPKPEATSKGLGRNESYTGALLVRQPKPRVRYQYLF
jgi:hypothetical protein